MYFTGINIFGSLTCESLHVSLCASQWRCVHARFYARVFMRHIHFHSFIAGFPVSLPVLDYRLIGFSSYYYYTLSGVLLTQILMSPC